MEDFGAAARRLLAKMDERARKTNRAWELPYAPTSFGGAVSLVRSQGEAGSAKPSPQLSASLFARTPWVAANDNRAHTRHQWSRGARKGE